MRKISVIVKSVHNINSVIKDFNVVFNEFWRIAGSPFKFYVDSLASGFVTAYGSGLTHGVCGESCNFTISTKNAGSGTNSILQQISNYNHPNIF